MDAGMPISSNPLQLIAKSLGAPLGPGELGTIMARAGVGKTACLTHIALEHLLGGRRVLHVCIDEMAEKIKLWYGEFLKNIVALHPEEDLTRLQQRIEPLRFILAYLHQTFTPGRLEQSLHNLREQAKFDPSIVILDGLDFDRLQRSAIEEIQRFAVQNAVAVWISARTHRHITVTNERGVPYPCHEIDDLFRAILSLEPEPDAIRVRVLKHDNRYQPDHAKVALNPQTYLML